VKTFALASLLAVVGLGCGGPEPSPLAEHQAALRTWAPIAGRVSIDGVQVTGLSLIEGDGVFDPAREEVGLLLSRPLGARDVALDRWLATPTLTPDVRVVRTDGSEALLQDATLVGRTVVRSGAVAIEKLELVCEKVERVLR
jgi:hypothetical protein